MRLRKNKIEKKKKMKINDEVEREKLFTKQQRYMGKKYEKNLFRFHPKQLYCERAWGNIPQDVFQSG